MYHPTPNKTKSADKAKKIILAAMAEGVTVEQACKSAGKSIKTYEYYRRSDPAFKSLADRTRLGSVEKNFAEETAKNLDFKTWRSKYLKQETFAHQMNLIDVIEGRDPGWLHPSMKYEKGIADNRILLNIPPNHAKSITVTVDYVHIAERFVARIDRVGQVGVGSGDRSVHFQVVGLFDDRIGPRYVDDKIARGRHDDRAIGKGSKGSVST